MKCPKCDVHTRNETYEGIQIDRCPTCEGVWLDDGEIRQIIRERQKTFTDEEIRSVVGESSRVRISQSAEMVVYPCPRCGAEMEKHDLTGITVDRCPGRHGLWFDKGELEKAQIMAEQRQKIFSDSERQELLKRRTRRGMFAHFLSALAEPLHLK